MRFLLGMAFGAALYAFYVGDLKTPESMKPQAESSGFFKRIGDMFNR